MNDFFDNNLGTILAGAVVLLIVLLIVGNMIRKRKKGEKIIDCGGQCSSCGGGCSSVKKSSSDKELKYQKGYIRTVLEIDGMMCGMCESHMNDCLRNNFDVKTVISSHKKGTTSILSKEPLDEEKVKAEVDKIGYKVTGITVEEV